MSKRRKIITPLDYYKRVHEERYKAILGSGASFREKDMQPCVAEAWQEFRKFSGLDAGSKGIEPGCGTGINTITLSLEGFNMTGLDISPTAIKKACELGTQKGSDARFEVGDMFSTRFPDSCFDFVVNIWALHVIAEQPMRDKHLRECARILKPGGWVFLHNESSEQDVFNPEKGIEIQKKGGGEEETDIPLRTQVFKRPDGSEIEVSFPGHMPDGLSGRRSLREHHEELKRAGFEIARSWEGVMQQSADAPSNRMMVAFARKPV